MSMSAPAANVEPKGGSSTLTRGQTDVLFVDLDGSLVETDLFAESLLLAVRRDPSVLGRLPTWFMRGRAVLKRAVAERATPDMRRLPYCDEVVEFLHEQRRNGCRLVLATASDALVARELASQLGLFDDVLASDGTTNLKGPAKLKAIEDYCRENAFPTFAYLGDSRADLAIWRYAAQAYVVAPSGRLRSQVARLGRPTHVLGGPDRKGWAILRALRPGQWIKNIVLFAPLVLAHDFGALDKIMACVLALVAFCCAASATYVLNDLLDIEADRSHPHKRQRVFASGALPIIYGPPLALGLFVVAGSVAMAFLPPLFGVALAAYVVAATLYTIWLKQVVLVDVFVLAGLYTLRVLAGGAATGVPVSEWLLALSMFLFTSLAFGKRYAELAQLSSDDDLGSRGRGYLRSDRSLLEILGPISGYLSVLVLALYLHGDVVERLYPSHWALWLVCPLLMYWISRFWLLCKRGELSDDPLVFATKDRVSLAVGALSIMLAVIAMWRIA